MTDATPDDTRIPVILDVDTGVDDAWALMLAARSPRLDLRAVTCVSGNVGVDQVVANTAYVLDVAGAPEVPVGRGATRPLLTPPHHATEIHGPDGLGGFSRPSDRRIEKLHATDLLRRELMAAIGNGETITLVPLGPQTNIALLLRSHPEVAPGIERIVFMGGSASVGNVTALAEFNVYADPEATAIVLAAADELDIPVTMYGLDVFLDVEVGTADGARLAASHDSAAQLAGRLIEFSLGVFGGDACTIGDAGAVCAVIDPGGIGTGRYPVRVETGAGATRGQTVVDRRRWVGDAPVRSHRDGTATDVALTVDADRYRALWLSAFTG
ncbi:nucleoside hydrolase [Nakamurella deserti]|uniref:nucleoside hydrolase n=1 Tax=Nakamurella deserti TaxID=2164074 RepID=UPI000DBE4DC5|nr:nucleoside hydrolase [Nakamurella deserti]